MQGALSAAFSRRMEQADGGIDLLANTWVEVDAKARAEGSGVSIRSGDRGGERAGGGEER